jgi:hypothetical protein
LETIRANNTYIGSFVAATKAFGWEVVFDKRRRVIKDLYLQKDAKKKK